VNGYLVDTNIPSELTRARPNLRIEAFLRSAAQSSVFLSVMTIGGICNGIDSLPVGAKEAFYRTGLI
jgi:predicted nucleic acid-binding protein